MSSRSLNALQAAALLVSASYGIGFLFGSGELAVDHGMAGSAYGLATGCGMLLLATLAPSLWRLRLSMWELFGQRFGGGLKTLVAVLSVVWMAGVLAAQIQGGVAVLRLLGVAPAFAWVGVLACCLAAARLRLGLASAVFAVLLVCSAAVLVHALLVHGGGAIYLEAPARLVADAGSFRAGALLAMFVAVTALVCTGTDYHQFVQSARAPAAAGWGCALAGVVLIFISFLPPAVVVAMQSAGALPPLLDAKQVIPVAVSQAAASLMPGLDVLLLVALSAAALGSGAAILKTMAGAIAGAAAWVPAPLLRSPDLLALTVGALLAAAGQGIVDTMVSANVVYIGSVGPVFLTLLVGRRLPAASARCSVVTGFIVTTGVQIASRIDQLPFDANLASLVAGTSTAALALGWRTARTRGHRPKPLS
ncbi:MAG TPA: hypothetical protein VNU71_01130 [Burkholderiaceae bacterium]|nr:hypothetical protein [Burkholderiaceae bacterium]